MKRRLTSAWLFALALTACSPRPTPSQDVSDSLRTSLRENALKDVTVKQDRDKGVVTLGGSVASEPEKARAEALAKASAPRDVIANEITVLPPGAESEAKAIRSDLDEAIDKNLHAALIGAGFKDSITVSVKSAVVTLKGDVASERDRAAVEKLAAGVPNVKQVVNTIDVTNQRATTR